jgi:GNAT superfamily N-acetyltransferase
MTAADADAVARLTGELGYPATPDQIARRFARIDGRPDQIVLVAEDGGAPIAWLHVAAHPYLESDATAEILGLVVGEGRRSAGVGAALVAAAETWARRAGCRAMRVRSRITRERAHAFYERAGFRRIKTQHAFEKPLG